jgi:hypothetical protein
VWIFLTDGDTAAGRRRRTAARLGWHQRSGSGTPERTARRCSGRRSGSGTAERTAARLGEASADDGTARGSGGGVGGGVGATKQGDRNVHGGVLVGVVCVVSALFRSGSDVRKKRTARAIYTPNPLVPVGCFNRD